MQYRAPGAVEPVNPHLHNVPMQIAAERGIPALGVFLWFVVSLAPRAHAHVPRRPRTACSSATGIAALVAMLAAGMFEYNFGDSEFLMLFLVLITLPFAAHAADAPPRRSQSSARPAPRRWMRIVAATASAASASEVAARVCGARLPSASRAARRRSPTDPRPGVRRLRRV